MGVYADPNGVEIHFYDKEGTNQIRKSVKGKGLLHPLPRTVRRNKPDPIAQDYSLGSTDWLTDIMVADDEEELKKMTPSDTGACLTSTCSYMVRVQSDVKSLSGNGDSAEMENCGTLAIVPSGDKDLGERMATKVIYVFPEVAEKWYKTIDYLQSMHVEISHAP